MRSRGHEIFPPARLNTGDRVRSITSLSSTVEKLDAYDRMLEKARDLLAKLRDIVPSGDCKRNIDVVFATLHTPESGPSRGDVVWAISSFNLPISVEVR